MAAMPGSSNTVTDLPFLLRVRDGSDLTNKLMTGNNGKAVAEQSEANGVIRMADTTSENLDQDLSTND